MLFAASGLEGCAVKASDGEIGAVSDFLFDNRTWAIRWLEIDTGHWLPGRKALIHPSAIAPLELPPKRVLPMMSGGDRLELSVNLTKSQIEAAPHLGGDEQVTMDMELLLYDYYAWDPYWGMTHFGGEALPNAEARLAGDAEQGAELPPPTAPIICIARPLSRATPFTRSTATSAMSRTCSSTISNWEIRYLVIATRNWWPGKSCGFRPMP